MKKGVDRLGRVICRAPREFRCFDDPGMGCLPPIWRQGPELMLLRRSIQPERNSQNARLSQPLCCAKVNQALVKTRGITCLSAASRGLVATTVPGSPGGTLPYDRAAPARPDNTCAVRLPVVGRNRLPPRSAEELLMVLPSGWRDPASCAVRAVRVPRLPRQPHASARKHPGNPWHRCD